MARNKKKENKTLEDYLPAITLEDEIDYSFITPRELHFFKIYKSLREGLGRKYPNPNPEDEDDTIDVAQTKLDSKASLFTDALTKVKAIMDKNERLRLLITDYEKYCIRLYVKLLLNWTWESGNKKRQKDIKQFCSAFARSDIYEIVETYFKIMRKYHEPTFEEPYYFLQPKDRRKVKYDGEMLKRSTFFDDNEIHISILEELE